MMATAGKHLGCGGFSGAEISQNLIDPKKTPGPFKKVGICLSGEKDKEIQT